MNKTSDEIQRKFKIKMSTLIKTFNLSLSHLICNSNIGNLKLFISA